MSPIHENMKRVYKETLSFPLINVKALLILSYSHADYDIAFRMADCENISILRVVKRFTPLRVLTLKAQTQKPIRRSQCVKPVLYRQSGHLRVRVNVPSLR